MKSMKNTKIFQQLSAIIILLVMFSGCKLEKANISPNSPTEVPPSVMLPFAEEGLARLSISTPQVMAGIFVQYYDGIDNHPIQVQQYILNEALYVDWDWNDYYDGPMINLRIMIDRAEAADMFYYSGIGKVLLANCLGNVTSLWGDVPYSEALQGSVNRHPVFDSQQSVYEAIQQLLDSGISDLQTDYEGQKPGADDIIFGGDANKWVQAAYALKARYYMHLSKRSGELGYNLFEKAIEAASLAMTGSDGDLEYHYGFSASEYSPFYSYTLLNYIIPSDFFTTLMLQFNDPRKGFFYKKKFGEVNLNGLYYTSTNSPVLLMTYHELKFIEAEARLRLNENDPLAQTALNEAVLASINKITAGETSQETIDAYLADFAVLDGDFNGKLETLILQKYIALFATIESWTDYRRTGFPVLIPNEGGDQNQNPGGAIPRRFAYPQTERLYNQNFPEYLPNLQDRFWWDQ